MGRRCDPIKKQWNGDQIGCGNEVTPCGVGRSDNGGFAELVEGCTIVEARRALEEEEGGTVGMSWTIKEKS